MELFTYTAQAEEALISVSTVCYHLNESFWGTPYLVMSSSSQSVNFVTYDS